nr:unnamed protein product [Callosobruchus analis]
MQLILDCKTRWSSLFSMLERFVFLENCVKKAMIDFKMEPMSSSEFQLLNNLAKLLEPIKLTLRTCILYIRNFRSNCFNKIRMFLNQVIV